MFREDLPENIVKRNACAILRINDHPSQRGRNGLSALAIMSPSCLRRQEHHGSARRPPNQRNSVKSSMPGEEENQTCI
jgi:hypothetical protein